MATGWVIPDGLTKQGITKVKSTVASWTTRVYWGMLHVMSCKDTDVAAVMLRLKRSLLRLNNIRPEWQIHWWKHRCSKCFLFGSNPAIKQAVKTMIRAFPLCSTFHSYCPLICTVFPGTGVHVSWNTVHWKHACQISHIPVTHISRTTNSGDFCFWDFFFFDHLRLLELVWIEKYGNPTNSGPYRHRQSVSQRLSSDSKMTEVWFTNNLM